MVWCGGGAGGVSGMVVLVVGRGWQAIPLFDGLGLGREGGLECGNFFLSFGVGWRGVGLNVVGRVLRDRGIGNCGRESLSVLFGDRLDRGDRFDRFWQPRTAAGWEKMV